MASLEQNYLIQQAAMPDWRYTHYTQSFPILDTTEAPVMGVYPGGSPSQHLGQVKQMRKRFKEYSKVEFREISNRPVIKDILSGMTKLNSDEIKGRIAEHLTNA